ncbi:hypothetical protein H3221_022160 [Pseudomonas sp. LMG 31766]|uniref:Uncharacterized protein n=1 Tax=Pseudomonas chaetocerotis TaxID=2758695 RepID=A0A931D7K9_9PSED|nr:hypothetical protein [Pseudomonas chaetocerotis]MBZ9667448.1 hypothetical protein [Pseudomonas chaetocerotis]
MTVALLPHRVVVPAYGEGPRVEIRFRLLRDGEVTPGLKRIRVYRGWLGVGQLDAVFQAEDGEFTAIQRFDLATLLAQGDWLVAGLDNTPPRRTRATYLALAESGTYTFNITSGDGGQAGEPAQVEARVRVERMPTSREVVLLERPIDGEWRIAGYGPTPGGAGEIDLRVVGGDVYALAVDDYGVQFVADLAVQVGQRIRPTQYTGWVYEITEAGQLPSVEPAWWAAVGENPSQPLGTARAVARRYFQPIALGPGPVEVV